MKLFAVLALLLGSNSFLQAQTSETGSTSVPAASAKAKPIKHGNLNSAVDWGEMKSKGAARRLTATPASSQFAYDKSGRVTKVLEADKLGKPSIETDITYGPSGRVTQIVQLGAKGDAARTRTFTYDEHSQLVETVSPEAGRIVYSHDAAGNIATKTDALGTTTTYLYDTQKRIVEKSYSDGTPTVRYRYSGPDHSVHSFAVIDGKRVYDRQYHFNANHAVDYIGQRFPSANGDYSYGIGLSYDSKGRLRSIRYPDGRVVVQDLDAKGNLLSVSDAGASYLSGAVYSSTHLLTSATLGNGTTITKTYDDKQKLQSLAANAGEKKLLGNVYHYNSLGSLTAVDDVLTPSESIEYRYDEMNRIAGAKTQDGSLKQRFTYDAFGNKALSNDAEEASAFDEHNRYSRVAGVSYSGIGEMTSDGRHSYTFNAEGMITAVDGGDIQYIYDADGNRVRKIVDGRTDDLIWMYGKLLAEKRADGTWIDYIYANGQRIARAAQTAPDRDGKVAAVKLTYFLTDTLGVTRVALSQTSDVVAAGFFAPFGEKIREKKAGHKGEGSGAESISYSDEIHDSETGLDTYHYRSYNPVLGRWMSPDPSSEHFSRLSNPQTFNLYAYVVNDPLKYLDQLGLYADDGSGDCIDCGIGDGTGTGDGLMQDLGTGSGGGGEVPGGCGASDPYCTNVTTDPNPPVDPNPPGPTDPCGANDGTCVNVTTDPNPPLDPGPIDGCYGNGCSIGTDPVPVHGPWHYGNFCGAGGTGTPINAVDNACMLHDTCFDNAKTDWSSMQNDAAWNLLSPTQQGLVQGCNQTLCNSMKAISPTIPWWDLSESIADSEILKYFQGHVPAGAQCK